MANTIRLRRGLEADRTTITPAEGEMIYTTDTNSLYIGDGSTAGGVKFDFNLDDIDVDTITANQLDIKEAYFQALTNTLTGTAVDTYIYIPALDDTDGGAWRKRCQHTSWYNETLNTATRGATREFPSIVGIVAESNKVTLYDMSAGDPVMWMVFNSGTAYYMLTSGGSASTISSIVIREGVLFVGTSNSAGMNYVDFNVDEGGLYFTSGKYRFSKNISGRNSVGSIALTDSSAAIVNNVINDIALTVLPKNGRYTATGITKTDIVVGTDGDGVYLASVIRADGSVYDIGTDGGYTCESVVIDDDHSLTIVRSDGTVYVWDSIASITSDGTSPDATYTTSSTPALLGTVTKVAA